MEIAPNEFTITKWNIHKIIIEKRSNDIRLVELNHSPSLTYLLHRLEDVKAMNLIMQLIHKIYRDESSVLFLEYDCEKDYLINYENCDNEVDKINWIVCDFINSCKENFEQKMIAMKSAMKFPIFQQDTIDQVRDKIIKHVHRDNQ